MTEISPNLINRLRERLEKELEELDALLQETARDSATVQLDQQSVGRLTRMDAMRVQAMAQETQRRRRERRPRIEAALKRIERGEYGYCTRCGEAISEKRLEVDPTYPLCVNCAG
jgi:DnaK suppressor protein